MRIISDKKRAMRQSKMSIEEIPNPSSTEPLFSYLTINGHRLETPIEGVMLKTTFQVGHRYLAFITDGILHEDTLWVYLIDEHYQVIDKIWFFAMYSTGTLTDMQIQSHDTVTFSFFKDDRWQLTVHQNKKRQFPWVWKQFCAHREFSFFCYLTLKTH